MKKLTPILGVIAGFACFGLASSANAQELSIEGITYIGTGCPTGTAAVEALPGGTALIAIFNDFTVQTQNTPTKNCDIQIRVRYPQGYTFSMAKGAWRGSAILDPQVDTWVRVQHSLLGSTPVSDEIQLSGPYQGSFEIIMDFEPPVWAACGGGVATLLATGTAQVNNLGGPSQSGLVAVEQMDIRLDVKRC